MAHPPRRLGGCEQTRRLADEAEVFDLFVKYYKVDMKEAQKPDTAAYRTFNDFFVRPLLVRRSPAEYRSNVLVMPARWRDQPAWRRELDKSCGLKVMTTVWKPCWPATTIRWPACSVTAASPPTYLSPRALSPQPHMPCNASYMK